MKKIVRIVMGILVITAFFTCCNEGHSSDKDTVFDVDFIEGEIYNGFLFRLKEETDLSKMPDYLEEGVFREIIPARRLYYSDTVDAIKARYASDDIVYIEPNYTMRLMD